jgi:hypothetical protein
MHEFTDGNIARGTNRFFPQPVVDAAAVKVMKTRQCFDVHSNSKFIQTNHAGICQKLFVIGRQYSSRQRFNHAAVDAVDAILTIDSVSSA